MSRLKYREFPVPPLVGRQTVRDLLDAFFAEYYHSDNPRADFEKLVNGIVDIAVQEVKGQLNGNEIVETEPPITTIKYPQKVIKGD